MDTLDYLVRMGREEEDEDGQEEINKIEAFLKKYYANELTIQDIKSFSFELSIGSFRCIDVAEGVDAIAALEAAHLKAK